MGTSSVSRRLRPHRAARGRSASRRQAPLTSLRSAGQSGFSLLEVLVAFAILALTMGVLLQIFSRALSTTSVSGSFARAAELAEATLARAGVETPLEEGDSAGEAEGGLTWAMRVTQIDVSDLFPDQSPPVTTYRVTATAYWKDGAAERHFSLATLRLGEAPETAGLGAADAPVRAPRVQSPSASKTGSQ
jgi:general secretion pathway protein I